MVIWILFEIYLFINSITVINSASILAIFPMPSISHHILGSKITNELMERGHHVTIITAYPDRLGQKGYEIISVEENLNIFKGYSKSSSLGGSKEVNLEKTSAKSFFDREAHSPFEAIVYLNDISLQVAESTLANKNVQQLLKSGRKFDLVFMEYFLNEAYFGLGKVFKAPIVLLSTLPSSIFNDYLFANPGLPTYLPHILSPFSSDMNLWQRIHNSIITLFDIGYKHLVILPKHRALVRKYISDSIDLDHIILHDVSLMLTNSHPSINAAVPHVKNIIEIGGFHIEPVGNSSNYLQKILDSSEDGVVIFSMGSNLNINDLPREMVDNIMRSLSTIKQKVIFKWNGDLSKKVPKNVILVDWLPQKDVLGHPNIKAFVTHGGLLSVIEAAYHGIPMIGIPIYGDQRMNIATAVKDAYAVMVPFKELAGDSLSIALNEILTNETYTRNAKLRSMLLKDRFTKPLVTAVYWIEYVIRYKGVDHLRSPGVKLRWYERNMLDIIVILTLITIILFLIFYYIIKHIIHCIFKRVTCRKHHEKSD